METMEKTGTTDLPEREDKVSRLLDELDFSQAVYSSKVIKKSDDGLPIKYAHKFDFGAFAVEATSYRVFDGVTVDRIGDFQCRLDLCDERFRKMRDASVGNTYDKMAALLKGFIDAQGSAATPGEIAECLDKVRIVDDALLYGDEPVRNAFIQYDRDSGTFFAEGYDATSSWTVPVTPEKLRAFADFIEKMGDTRKHSNIGNNHR